MLNGNRKNLRKGYIGIGNKSNNGIATSTYHTKRVID